MNSRKILTLILMFLLLFTCTALAQDAITVQGTASVQLTPDMAIISVGARSEADSVITAQTSVNTIINAIVEKLTSEEFGLDKKDICTSQYSIDETYHYNSIKGESVKDGYRATCILGIRVRNLDQAGAVLDAAIQAGANQLDGVQFLSTNEQTARDEALKMAVQDAMRKAQIIADAAGLTLPAVPTSIQEDSVYSYSNVSRNAYALDTVAEKEDSGTQLQSGMLTVSASVTVTY